LLILTFIKALNKIYAENQLVGPAIKASEMKNERRTARNDGKSSNEMYLEDTIFLTIGL